jgi:hypothetical protein
MTYDHEKKGNWWHKVPDTGWGKEIKASVRRQRMLKAHGYDLRAAGKAMNSLANVTKDKASQRAARADAHYFFRQQEKINQGKSMRFVD